jgi:hypothetical protein
MVFILLNEGVHPAGGGKKRTRWRLAPGRVKTKAAIAGKFSAFAMLKMVRAGG